MKKIHLDTDIGGDIDDLNALVYLLNHPDADLIGITTVAEDGGRRAGYARRVLELAGRIEIPLRAGADVASGRFAYAPGYPDTVRYWQTPLSPAPSDMDEAIELLKRSVEAGAILIGIGQFTNFYYLEQRYPGILRDAHLVLMGGYFAHAGPGYPEWNDEIDYNLQLDAAAAQFVLEHSDPTIVPIPISLSTHLTFDDVEILKQGGVLSQLIAHQAEMFAEDEQFAESYRDCEMIPDNFINFQYDPLACAAALGAPVGLEFSQMGLTFTLEDGLLRERIDPSGKPFKVLTGVDATAFTCHWREIVARG